MLSQGHLIRPAFQKDPGSWREMRLRVNLEAKRQREGIFVIILQEVADPQLDLRP